MKCKPDASLPSSQTPLLSFPPPSSSSSEPIPIKSASLRETGIAIPSMSPKPERYPTRSSWHSATFHSSAMMDSVNKTKNSSLPKKHVHFQLSCNTFRHLPKDSATYWKKVEKQFHLHHIFHPVQFAFAHYSLYDHHGQPVVNMGLNDHWSSVAPQRRRTQSMPTKPEDRKQFLEGKRKELQKATDHLRSTFSLRSPGSSLLRSHGPIYIDKKRMEAMLKCDPEASAETWQHICSIIPCKQASPSLLRFNKSSVGSHSHHRMQKDDLIKKSKDLVVHS